MARLRFPGRPGCRFDRLGVRYGADEAKNVKDPTLAIVANIHRGLRLFKELFGDSDEEEEFEGFTPQDVKKAEKKFKQALALYEKDDESEEEEETEYSLSSAVVGTRLAKTRKSIEDLPTSERTRNREKKVICKSYKELIKKGLASPSKSYIIKAARDLKSAQEETRAALKKSRSKHAISPVLQRKGKQVSYSLKSIKMDFGRKIEKKSKIVKGRSPSVLDSKLKKQFKTEISKKDVKKSTKAIKLGGKFDKVKKKIKETDKPSLILKPGKLKAKQLLAKAKKGQKSPEEKAKTPDGAIKHSYHKRQFLLPAQSSRSARRIIPNKRFLEDDSYNALVVKRQSLDTSHVAVDDIDMEHVDNIYLVNDRRRSISSPALGPGMNLTKEKMGSSPKAKSVLSPKSVGSFKETTHIKSPGIPLGNFETVHVPIAAAISGPKVGLLDKPLVVEGKRERKLSLKMKLKLSEGVYQEMREKSIQKKLLGRKAIEESKKKIEDDKQPEKSAENRAILLSPSKLGHQASPIVAPPKFGVSSEERHRLEALEREALATRRKGHNILRKAKLQLNRKALNRSKADLARTLKAELKLEAKMEKQRLKQEKEQPTFSKYTSSFSGMSKSYMDVAEGLSDTSEKTQWKIMPPDKFRRHCAVCGDPKLKPGSKAFYHGVPSCINCRKFYRENTRTKQTQTEQQCKSQGNCLVSYEDTSPCKPCWLSKCVEVFKKCSVGQKPIEPIRIQIASPGTESTWKQEMISPVIAEMAEDVIDITKEDESFTEEKLKTTDGESAVLKSPESASKKRAPVKSTKPMTSPRSIIRHKEKAVSVEVTSSPEVTNSPKSDTRGPRIKHVCRNAAVVLGKPVAKFPPKTSGIRLSALPQGEKTKLWKKDEEEKAGLYIKRPREFSDDELPMEEIIQQSEDNVVTVKRSPLKSPPKTVRKPGGGTGTTGRRRKIRCRECEGCLAEDCGSCSYCRDKPKFGGRGVMKQACVERRCKFPRYARLATRAFIKPKTDAESGHTPGQDSPDKLSTQDNTSSEKHSPSLREGGWDETGRCKQSTNSTNSNSVTMANDPNNAKLNILRRMVLQNNASTAGEGRNKCTGTEANRNSNNGNSKKPADVSRQLLHHFGGDKNGSSEIPTVPSLSGCLYETDGRGRKNFQLQQMTKLSKKIMAESRSDRQQNVANIVRQWSTSGVTNHRIKAEYKENCNLSSVWMRGLSLTMSSPLCVRTVCFLCGSAGKHEMVYCSVCCEPFHDFCLEEHERPNEDNSENWCCRQCQFCNVCGHQNNLLRCDKCQNTYHPECLGPNYPTQPSKKKRIWICTKCVRCKSCGATTPGSGNSAIWTYDFQLCYECGQLMDKGNFCPICHKCYSDDDWESKMVQCVKCESWVHAKCEGLTDEMYERVSFLPEDVHYICKMCSPPDKVRHWELVLKDDFMAGLKSVFYTVYNAKCSHHLINVPEKQEKKLLETVIQKAVETKPQTQDSKHFIDTVSKHSENQEAENLIHTDSIYSQKPDSVKQILQKVHCDTNIENKEIQKNEQNNILFTNNLCDVKSLTSSNVSSSDYKSSVAVDHKISNESSNKVAMETQISKIDVTDANSNEKTDACKNTPVKIDLDNLEGSSVQHDSAGKLAVEFKNSSFSKAVCDKIDISASGGNESPTNTFVCENMEVDLSVNWTSSSEKGEQDRTENAMMGRTIFDENPVECVENLTLPESKISEDEVDGQKCSSSHQRLQESSHQELEETSHQELEESSHQELEETSHQELEESSHQDLEKSSHQDLEKSSHQKLEESSHQDLEKSSHQDLEKSSHQDLEKSSHQDLEKSSHQKLEESSHQEHQELEEKFVKNEMERVCVQLQTSEESINQSEISEGDCNQSETNKDTSNQSEETKEDCVQSNSVSTIVDQSESTILNQLAGSAVKTSVNFTTSIIKSPDGNSEQKPLQMNNQLTKVLSHVHFADNRSWNIPSRDYPRDFLNVRYKLEKDKYISVEEFVEDMAHIIKAAVNDPDEVRAVRKKASNSVRSMFMKMMEKCFPWYNIKTDRLWDLNKNLPHGMLPDAILPPSEDHTYAQWLQREGIPRSPQPSPFKKIQNTPVKKILPMTLHEDDEKILSSDLEDAGEDTRRCSFCWHYGDGDPNETGRLLYASQDDWVHVNCALWSAEVYEEEHDGSLQNVHSAVSRGKMMKCDSCNRSGATVGCNTRGCTGNYHFMCARKDNCVFQEDKKVFCKLHRDRTDGALVHGDKFDVHRRVCVDTENIRLPKKTWNKGLNPIEVSILIGSCTVESLGKLSPLSDCPGLLQPIDFSCTRVYWSAKDARRRCIYTCRIIEIKPDSPKSSVPIRDMTVIHDESHPDYVPLTELDIPGINLFPNATIDKEPEMDVINLTNDVFERRQSYGYSVSDYDISMDSAISNENSSFEMIRTVSPNMNRMQNLSSSFNGSSNEAKCKESESLSSSWPNFKKTDKSNNEKSLSGPDLSLLSPRTLKLLNIKDPKNFKYKNNENETQCKYDDDFGALIKIADRLNQGAAKSSGRKSEERILPDNLPKSCRRKSEERILPDNCPTSSRCKSEERIFPDNRPTSSRCKSEDRILYGNRPTSCPPIQLSTTRARSLRSPSVERVISPPQFCSNDRNLASVENQDIVSTASYDLAKPETAITIADSDENELTELESSLKSVSEEESNIQETVVVLPDDCGDLTEEEIIQLVQEAMRNQEVNQESSMDADVSMETFQEDSINSDVINNDGIDESMTIEDHEMEQRIGFRFQSSSSLHSDESINQINSDTKPDSMDIIDLTNDDAETVIDLSKLPDNEADEQSSTNSGKNGIFPVLDSISELGSRQSAFTLATSASDNNNLPSVTEFSNIPSTVDQILKTDDKSRSSQLLSVLPDTRSKQSSNSPLSVKECFSKLLEKTTEKVNSKDIKSLPKVSESISTMPILPLENSSSFKKSVNKDIPSDEIVKTAQYSTAEQSSFKHFVNDFQKTSELISSAELPSLQVTKTLNSITMVTDTSKTVMSVSSNITFSSASSSDIVCSPSERSIVTGEQSHELVAMDTSRKSSSSTRDSVTSENCDIEQDVLLAMQEHLRRKLLEKVDSQKKCDELDQGYNSHFDEKCNKVYEEKEQVDSTECLTKTVSCDTTGNKKNRADVTSDIFATVSSGNIITVSFSARECRKSISDPKMEKISVISEIKNETPTVDISMSDIVNKQLNEIYNLSEKKLIVPESSSYRLMTLESDKKSGKDGSVLRSICKTPTPESKEEDILIPVYNKQGLLIGHKLSAQALSLGLKNKDAQKIEALQKTSSKLEKATKTESEEIANSEAEDKNISATTASSVITDVEMVESVTGRKEDLVKAKTRNETELKSEEKKSEISEEIFDTKALECDKHLSDDDKDKPENKEELDDKSKLLKTKEEIKREEEKAEILKGLGLERTPKANEIRQAMKKSQLKTYPLRHLGKTSSPGTSPVKDSENFENMDELPIHDKLALKIKEESLAKSSPGDKGPFKCPTCKRSYRTKESYNSHVEFCDFEVSTSDEEEEDSENKVPGRYPMRKSTVVQRLAMESEERERQEAEPVVRKRGRPPKDKDERIIETSTKKTPVLSPIPKRRGRPPSKNIANMSVESDFENSEIDTTPTVKHRGRPPSKEKANISMESDKSEIDTTPLVKRRGRPPKISGEQDTVLENKSGNMKNKHQRRSNSDTSFDGGIKSPISKENFSVESKRRRGRPSKSDKEIKNVGKSEKRIRTPSKAMADFITDFDSVEYEESYSDDGNLEKNRNISDSFKMSQKRGRPRKRSLDSSLNSSVDMSTPKKRGRPAKRPFKLSPKVVLDRLTPSKLSKKSKLDSPGKRGRGRPPKLHKQKYLSAKGGILKKYANLKLGKLLTSEKTSKNVSRKRRGSPVEDESISRGSKILKKTKNLSSVDSSESNSVVKKCVGRPPKKKRKWPLHKKSDVKKLRDNESKKTYVGSENNPIKIGSCSETDDPVKRHNCESGDENFSQDKTIHVKEDIVPSSPEEREFTLDEQTGMVINSEGSVLSPSSLVKGSPKELKPLALSPNINNKEQHNKSEKSSPNSNRNVFDILTQVAEHCFESEKNKEILSNSAMDEIRQIGSVNSTDKDSVTNSTSTSDKQSEIAKSESPKDRMDKDIASITPALSNKDTATQICLDDIDPQSTDSSDSREIIITSDKASYPYVSSKKEEPVGIHGEESFGIHGEESVGIHREESVGIHGEESVVDKHSPTKTDSGNIPENTPAIIQVGIHGVGSYLKSEIDKEHTSFSKLEEKSNETLSPSSIKDLIKEKVTSPKKLPDSQSSPDLRYAAQLIKHLPAKDVENLVGLSRFSTASQIASLITSLVEKNNSKNNTSNRSKPGSSGNNPSLDTASKNLSGYWDKSSGRKSSPEKVHARSRKTSGGMGKSNSHDKKKIHEIGSTQKLSAIESKSSNFSYSGQSQITYGAEQSQAASAVEQSRTTCDAIIPLSSYCTSSVNNNIQSRTREAIHKLLSAHRAPVPFSESPLIYTSLQSQAQDLSSQLRVQGLHSQVQGQGLLNQTSFNLSSIQQMPNLQQVAVGNPIQQVPSLQVIQQPQPPAILTLTPPQCQPVVIDPLLGPVPVQNAAITNAAIASSFQNSGFVSNQLVNMNAINTNQNLLPSNMMYSTNVNNSANINQLIQNTVVPSSLGFQQIQNNYSNTRYSGPQVQNFSSFTNSDISSSNQSAEIRSLGDYSNTMNSLNNSNQLQSNSSSQKSHSNAITPCVSTPVTSSNTLVRIFVDGKPVAMTTDPSVLNMQDHSSLLSKLATSKLQAGKYSISVSSHSMQTQSPRILPANHRAITPTTSSPLTSNSSPSKDHKVLHSMLQSKSGLGKHAINTAISSRLDTAKSANRTLLPSPCQMTTVSSNLTKTIISPLSSSRIHKTISPSSRLTPVVSPSLSSQMLKQTSTVPSLLTSLMNSPMNISDGQRLPLTTPSVITPLTTSQIQKSQTLANLRSKIVGSHMKLVPANQEAIKCVSLPEKSTSVPAVTPHTSFIRRPDGTVVKRTVMKPNILHHRKRQSPPSAGSHSKRAIMSIGEKNGLATGTLSKVLVRKIIREVKKNGTPSTQSGMNVVKMKISKLREQLEGNQKGGHQGLKFGIEEKSSESFKRSPKKKPTKAAVRRRKTPLKPRNINQPHKSGAISHPIIHPQKEVPVLPQPAVEEEVTETPMYTVFEQEANVQQQKEEIRRKNGPRLMFEIVSDDGFSCRADTMDEAWKQVTEKVQDARAAARLKHVSFASLSGVRMFGLNHNAIVYLIEQLYGAVHCRSYKFKFHKYDHLAEEEISAETPTGSIRSEPYQGRKPFDIFSFLMSQYRQMPAVVTRSEDIEMVHKSSRRATSMELPMAMRFRKLKDHAREAVGVFRSNIHGRGLFCKRNIDAGEMVIEYSGEVIRASLTDKREQYYERKGIGCYMFRIDDQEVVDATLHGSAARFINHSCEPNCYSKVIQVDGKKHIVIFAMRAITRGEELTYDYKFPIEEVKIPCTCGSKRCRKYLN